MAHVETLSGTHLCEKALLKDYINFPCIVLCKPYVKISYNSGRTPEDPALEPVIKHFANLSYEYYTCEHSRFQ